MEQELTKQKLRLYRLVNGLLAVVYITGFAFLLAQLYKIIF